MHQYKHTTSAQNNTKLFQLESISYLQQIICIYLYNTQQNRAATSPLKLSVSDVLLNQITIPFDCELRSSTLGINFLLSGCKYQTHFRYFQYLVVGNRYFSVFQIWGQYQYRLFKILDTGSVFRKTNPTLTQSLQIYICRLRCLGCKV